jgi:hypothetical protein
LRNISLEGEHFGSPFLFGALVQQPFAGNFQ